MNEVIESFLEIEQAINSKCTYDHFNVLIIEFDLVLSRLHNCSETMHRRGHPYCYEEDLTEEKINKLIKRYFDKLSNTSSMSCPEVSAIFADLERMLLRKLYLRKGNFKSYHSN